MLRAVVRLASATESSGSEAVRLLRVGAGLEDAGEEGAGAGVSRRQINGGRAACLVGLASLLAHEGCSQSVRSAAGRALVRAITEAGAAGVGAGAGAGADKLGLLASRLLSSAIGAAGAAAGDGEASAGGELGRVLGVDADAGASAGSVEGSTDSPVAWATGELRSAAAAAAAGKSERVAGAGEDAAAVLRVLVTRCGGLSAAADVQGWARATVSAGSAEEGGVQGRG